ncbi:MAG: peptide-methionine (S)-S-oxide reductase MsrA [Gammaproteobacteria bacterium]|nr:peptide-methionine (S)-S-oxide reductase MsrA [Gammaproteobacteria bacterium]
MSNKHLFLNTPIHPPFPENLSTIIFGMGCFWGVEKLFWQQKGIYTTAVGYAGGDTENPTYQQVCTGQTGHTEVVLIVYDPEVISFKQLLELFWQNHDPTQGMRQGNDRGTQYRSAIYVNNQEYVLQSQESLQHYQSQLTQQGYPEITTEIKLQSKFYYAEEYHQQYLIKNPNGYCNLRGTGVIF